MKLLAKYEKEIIATVIATIFAIIMSLDPSVIWQYQASSFGMGLFLFIKQLNNPITTTQQRNKTTKHTQLHNKPTAQLHNTNTQRLHKGPQTVRRASSYQNFTAFTRARYDGQKSYAYLPIPLLVVSLIGKIDQLYYLTQVYSKYIDTYYLNY